VARNRLSSWQTEKELSRAARKLDAELTEDKKRGRLSAPVPRGAAKKQ